MFKLAVSGIKLGVTNGFIGRLYSNADQSEAAEERGLKSEELPKVVQNWFDGKRGIIEGG